VNNAPWYRIDDISNRINALPSSEKAQDFLQLRYIDYRPIEEAASQNSNNSYNDAKAEISGTKADTLHIPIYDVQKFHLSRL
jgi:hypothetical protein